MLTDRTTLTQFLIEEGRRYPCPSGELNSLILNVALACKAIAQRVAYGALGGVLGAGTTTSFQGEAQRRLDLVANDVFLRANEWGGVISGMVSGMMSGESETPHPIPERYPRGKYLLAFDPLDGSSNIEVNVPVGSIFSILRAPHPGQNPSAADFLQPGSEQVCAGYAMYGPSTVVVVTVGTGVHGFTLEPQLGEFILTHPAIQVPTTASEFAINASKSRFWEPAVTRYVEECLAGSTGPRGKDFTMRWVASLVAETHRILTCGGVFLAPRETGKAAKPGQLRLLYEANPVAFIVEQAGGLASTGRARVLDIAPEDLHQRIPFIFGAREEVERIEQYHRDHSAVKDDAPLYGRRGLFRSND
jgi:fructose-1,6-bisphosphatase I / sedoheptulose-1,7-bisphosphatase